MIENVIVTIVYAKQAYDIELPANTSVTRLKPVIAEALSRKALPMQGDFTLACNGNALRGADTLFDAGVWDGSYLIVT